MHWFKFVWEKWNIFQIFCDQWNVIERKFALKFNQNSDSLINSFLFEIKLCKASACIQNFWIWCCLFGGEYSECIHLKWQPMKRSITVDFCAKTWCWFIMLTLKNEPKTEMNNLSKWSLSVNQFRLIVCAMHVAWVLCAKRS